MPKAILKRRRSEPAADAPADLGDIDVVMIVDRLDWALGAFAKEVSARISLPFVFHLWDAKLIAERPVAFAKALRCANIVHSSQEHEFLKFRGLTKSSTKHILSIAHVLDVRSWDPATFERAAVVVMSEQWKEILQSAGTPVFGVIRFGVDTTLFRPLPKGPSRLELGLDGERFYISFAGKKTSDAWGRKGLDVFEATCVELASNPEIGVVLIGEGWLPFAQSLRRMGIDATVFDAVSQSAVAKILGSTDAYVCTSRMEGGPLPVLEAMACALPVVSTRVGHVPELIVDGISGLLVGFDDPAGTAARVRELRANPSRAHLIGEAARAVVTDGANWGTAAAQFEAVLRSPKCGSLGDIPRAERVRAAISLARSWTRRNRVDRFVLDDVPRPATASS